jgi:hypothetical protein
MKRAWLIAFVLTIATPAAAQQYQYVARTEAPAARQGAVTAGILTWQCQGSACTIVGPWPIPSPEACAQLAREVGRITAYGRTGRVLDAAGLATCNAGDAPPEAGPTQIYRPSDNRVTGTVAVPASRTYAINAPELYFIGGAVVGIAPPSTITIDAPELSFVGGGDAPPREETTITINAPELSFVGR